VLNHENGGACTQNKKGQSPETLCNDSSARQCVHIGLQRNTKEMESRSKKLNSGEQNNAPHSPAVHWPLALRSQNRKIHLVRSNQPGRDGEISQNRDEKMQACEARRDKGRKQRPEVRKLSNSDEQEERTASGATTKGCDESERKTVMLLRLRVQSGGWSGAKNRWLRGLFAGRRSTVWPQPRLIAACAPNSRRKAFCAVNPSQHANLTFQR